MRLLSSRRLAGLALYGVFLICGCAAVKHGHATAAATPTPGPPGPQRVGTIALVNTDLNFVLVDVGSLYAPEAGTALKSFSGGQESGILAVSAEKQRPFIVADIIRGNPKVGDEVRE